jgi:hypothetical protein
MNAVRFGLRREASKRRSATGPRSQRVIFRDGNIYLQPPVSRSAADGDRPRSVTKHEQSTHFPGRPGHRR